MRVSYSRNLEDFVKLLIMVTVGIQRHESHPPRNKLPSPSIDWQALTPLTKTIMYRYFLVARQQLERHRAKSVISPTRFESCNLLHVGANGFPDVGIRNSRTYGSMMGRERAGGGVDKTGSHASS
jgi:hypothetical protein